jgi:GTP cyclohydrolase FolE2
MRRTTDLPGTRPSLPYELEWVGAEGIWSSICFRPVIEGDPDPLWLMCNVDMHTSLDGSRRGVHLSRLPEELVRMKRKDGVDTVLGFCEKLATRIRDVQAQQRGRVRISAQHCIERVTRATKIPTLIPIKLGATVTVCETGIIYSSSLSVETIIVCPSGMSMLREKAGRRTRVDADSLDIYPSHSQRALLTLTTTSSMPTAYERLLDMAEKATPLVGTTLKRPDELDLLVRVFSDPLFCEDLVRRCLDEINRDVGSVGVDSTFEASVRSEESIHPFSVVAYGRTKLRSLDTSTQLDHGQEPE